MIDWVHSFSFAFTRNTHIHIHPHMLLLGLTPILLYNLINLFCLILYNRFCILILIIISLLTHGLTAHGLYLPKLPTDLADLYEYVGTRSGSDPRPSDDGRHAGGEMIVMFLLFLGIVVGCVCVCGSVI